MSLLDKDLGLYTVDISRVAVLGTRLDSIFMIYISYPS